MNKILPLIIAVIVLSGCCGEKINRERRIEIFRDCLDRIPEGPQTTKYNDWAEVIKTCEDVAFYQSIEMVCQ
jgi:hypothetical protein